MNHTKFLPCLSAGFLTILSAASGFAGESAVSKTPLDAAPPADEKSVYDQIWSLATLYKSDTGFLNEISLTGRYNGQFWAADSETESDEGWENRRIRIGLKGKFLKDWEFNSQVDLNTEGGELYNGLTDSFIAWKPSKAFNLTLGKHHVEYTQEGSTSSTKILTLERSLLVNQVWPSPEYITGASVSGQVEKFLYRAGVYAGDFEKEYTRFDGGAGYLASVGYDFGKDAGLDTGIVKFDVFYNDGDSGNTAFRNYEATESFNVTVKKGPFGLVTDLIYAQGLGSTSDVWGLVLLPSYDITKKLQLVAKYQFATADTANGLTAARRYEREVGGGSGDTYNAGYVGVNYYLYGDKLKLMTGFEYAKLDGGTGAGYEGWSVISGVRLSF